MTNNNNNNDIRTNTKTNTKTKPGSLLNPFILFLTATVWGMGFVAQSKGMEYIGPFTFSSVRFFLAAMFLVPVCLIVYRKDLIKRINRDTVIAGLLCGVFLCIATNFQQVGIKYTTAGKAGFITSLYVVVVPVISIFLKKKPSIIVWISVALSVVGLYFLCVKNGELSLSKGDGLELVCAVVYAIHIMIIDHYSDRAEGIIMSGIQFLVSAVLSLVLCLVFENPTVSHMLMAWKPLCYAGIVSGGIGYTLQIVGQKNVNPTLASLIMCMESVVAAVAGLIILGQKMSIRETVGCLLMLAAVVLCNVFSNNDK